MEFDSPVPDSKHDVVLLSGNGTINETDVIRPIVMSIGPILKPQIGLLLGTSTSMTST